MFLFRRTHGVFYLRYKDRNHKWKSVSTKTKKLIEARNDNGRYLMLIEKIIS
jgi:hypothetical protein